MIDIHLPTTNGLHIVMRRYTQPEKDVSIKRKVPVANLNPP